MKLNTVIDASGLFYRSLYTVGNYGVSIGEKLLDSNKSQGIFMRKLATDFSSIVKEVENSNRTIVCLDSTSWRKSILIEDGGYKASREDKDESTINWKSFYEITEKFSTILGKKGYLISKVPGAEADDLMFFWSKKLNNENQNVILITGDRDLLQVVTYNDNGTWTIALDPINKRKKISLTQETLDSRSSSGPEPDIFDSSTWTDSSDSLDQLIRSFELNVVVPRKISFKKVIVGDGGDSVPSVVRWQNPKKKDGDLSDMSESNFLKIVENDPTMEDSTWEDLCAGKHLEIIASTMEKLKKMTIDREDLQAKILRNAKLVVLHEKTIPIQIQESFDSIHKVAPEMIAITGRDAILNGTEWWSKDSSDFVPSSYNLF